jgi:hypothetical protein
MIGHVWEKVMLRVASLLNAKKYPVYPGYLIGIKQLIRLIREFCVVEKPLGVMEKC